MNKPSTLFVNFFLILRVIWFSKFIIIFFFYKDATFGVLSLLPNLLSGYGWNPGMKLYNWMGEVIEKKMGNKDITFGEVNWLSWCKLHSYMYMYLLPLGKFYIFKLKSTIWQVDIKIDLYFKVIFSFNEENRDRCAFFIGWFWN